jgi:hypothetical protein
MPEQAEINQEALDDIITSSFMSSFEKVPFHQYVSNQD